MDRAAGAVTAWLADDVPGGRVLLINNSGIGAFGPFPEPDLPRQLQMIDVNVRGLVDLTGRLLPVLRGRGGAVLNVASTVAYQPTPYAATYGATKAFVLHWTVALDAEWRGTGVRAIALCPGTTRTEFFAAAGVAGGAVRLRGALSADEVAAAGYGALAGTGSAVVPGLLNRLMVAGAARLPKAWAARLAARAMAGRRSAPAPWLPSRRRTTIFRSAPALGRAAPACRVRCG